MGLEGRIILKVRKSHTHLIIWLGTVMSLKCWKCWQKKLEERLLEEKLEDLLKRKDSPTLLKIPGQPRMSPKVLCRPLQSRQTQDNHSKLNKISWWTNLRSWTKHGGIPNLQKTSPQEWPKLAAKPTISPTTRRTPNATVTRVLVWIRFLTQGDLSWSFSSILFINKLNKTILLNHLKKIESPKSPAFRCLIFSARVRGVFPVRMCFP